MLEVNREEDICEKNENDRYLRSKTHDFTLYVQSKTISLHVRLYNTYAQHNALIQYVSSEAQHSALNPRIFLRVKLQ